MKVNKKPLLRQAVAFILLINIKMSTKIMYEQDEWHDSIDQMIYFLIALSLHMSQCMRFPTMWYVRPAKPQISLRIRAV